MLRGAGAGVAGRGRGQGRRVRGGGSWSWTGEEGARSRIVVVGRGGGCDGRVLGREEAKGEARQRFVARQEASAAQINSGHFIRGEGGQGGGRDIGGEGG